MTFFSKISQTQFFQKLSLFAMLGLWASLSFSSALTEVCIWMAFVSWGLDLILNRKKPIFPDRLSCLLIGLFFCTVLISFMISDYPKQSFRGFFKLFRQLLIFLLALNIFSNSRFFNQWRNWLLIAFLILVINAGYQYFYGVDLVRGFYAQASNAGWRVSGSFETYGKFAAYLCSVLPIILFFTVHSFQNRLLRAELMLWIPISGIGIFLLYATRSRGAFLALSLALFLVLIFKKMWKTLLGLALCGLLFVSFLPRQMIIHLDSEGKEQSLVERAELWHRAIDVMKARPLTGTGINTYAVAHQQYDTRKSWRVKNYYAHNGYLQMGAEIGLPGLLFFICFLVRWIWLHRPRGIENQSIATPRWGFLGGMFGFLIFCLADTALHSPQPVMTFWYVAGLLGASSPRFFTSK